MEVRLKINEKNETFIEKEAKDYSNIWPSVI